MHVTEWCVFSLPPDAHGEKLSYTNPLMYEGLQGNADPSTLSEYG